MSYERNDATFAPAPGSAPINVPIKPDLNAVKMYFFKIEKGKKSFPIDLGIGDFSSLGKVLIISQIPNKPIKIGM